MACPDPSTTQAVSTSPHVSSFVLMTATCLTAAAFHTRTAKGGSCPALGAVEWSVRLSGDRFHVVTHVPVTVQTHLGSAGLHSVPKPARNDGKLIDAKTPLRSISAILA